MLMVYIVFAIISLLHLLDLYFLKKRNLDNKIFLTNLVLSVGIILISIYYFFSYGDEKISEYLIIISILYTIVAYLKINMNKWL